MKAMCKTNKSTTGMIIFLTLFFSLVWTPSFGSALAAASDTPGAFTGVAKKVIPTGNYSAQKNTIKGC